MKGTYEVQNMLHDFVSPRHTKTRPYRTFMKLPSEVLVSPPEGSLHKSGCHSGAWIAWHRCIDGLPLLLDHIRQDLPSPSRIDSDAVAVRFLVTGWFS